MATYSRIPLPVKSVTAAVLAVLSTNAMAAATTELEEVVVTGSLLLSGDQAKALPVRIVSADDLLKAGSPTMVDLLRSMPEAVGSIGSSNAEVGKGQGMNASGSVNLRGLGANRNLVLVNSLRMPMASGLFVNTNLIPMAAVQRVEVLKDGASTTYGSDAISGVINFVTKRNFDGFEIGGDYTHIDGNSGNKRMDATWGHVGDGWNVLISGAYQQMPRLETTDVSWANRPFEENPAATWNFSSNPSQFVPVAPNASGYLAANGPRAIDVGCLELGGMIYASAFCINQHGRYEDIVNQAKYSQVYAELNAEIWDGKQLHVETLLGTQRAIVNFPPSFNQPKPITETVLPDNINPASYGPGTDPRLFNQWFVPMTNPGLAAYAAANPAQFPAGTTGVFIPVGQWRPYFVGGNPFFGGDNPAYQTRDQDQFRVAVSLSGEFESGMSWDASASYGKNSHTLLGFDFTGVEIQLALRGLGGPGCDWQNGTPGQRGCLWLNPMSNAIAGAPRYGVPVNPGYDPAVANSKEVADWLMHEQIRYLKDDNLELNYVLNGDLPGISLGGGHISWAAGLQYREIGSAEHDSRFANREEVPCLDSPLDIPLANQCTPTPNTPLGLAVALSPRDTTIKVQAAYAEAVLPFTDRIEATLGARYEDYGSRLGSTFDPQFRARVQLFDWLALRGSIGTSFRAPSPSQISETRFSTIPNILGQARAADVLGNPDLDPEKATSYDVGLIFQTEHFDAAIDYYNYEIDDILTSEPLNPVVNALFPNGAAGANNCDTLDPDFIARHYVFSGVCSAANLIRVDLRSINGPTAKIDGIDLRAAYRFDEVLGGTLTLEAVATRTLGFEFDSFSIDGIIPVAGLDAVGKLNAGTLAFPLPDTKGQAYVNFEKGPVNLRWSTRYTASYLDDQNTAFLGPPARVAAQTLHDVAAVVDLPRDLQLTLAVNNVFDEDPPLVRQVYSYDALTADPLGRTYRIGLRMKFQ